MTDDKLGTPPGERDLLGAHTAKRRALRDKATLQQLVGQLEAQSANLELRLDAALGAIEAISRPLPPLEFSAARQPKPKAAQLVLISDLHPGERVRPEEVGGCNEFNVDIFHARMEQLWKRLLTILNVNRGGWDIDTLVAWLGGDLQTGWIHEEYVAENFLSPTEELYEMLEALVRGFRFLLDRSDVARIRIPTSNGNHGRNTDKMWTAGAFRTSYEFLLYRLLAREFANEPRMEFQLGLGYENLFDLYPGYRIGFHHGHEIKYQGGVGGIAPSMYRRYHRMNSGSLKAQLHCNGHHHSLGFYPGGTNNGSLIGPTPYGIAKGFAPEEPMMASFVVDERHLVQSAMTPILCKEPRRGGRK